MKKFKFVVINFILIFALIICAGISKVEAFTFFGEFCWLMDETGSSDPPDVINRLRCEVSTFYFGRQIARY